MYNLILVTSWADPESYIPSSPNLCPSDPSTLSQIPLQLRRNGSQPWKEHDGWIMSGTVSFSSHDLEFNPPQPSVNLNS